ncbi:hypothetical protein RvY_17044 [Ramazzottius varieornatus]|uniref:Uncharacterized protein n=1 Tax=Ramazzottius varieornatus TaxID=947166 RepID=A0A1D1W7V8_RAMVA|nr:hypothetical protein RvY_17044 [Ramazzottius varieornatus]
MAFSTHIHISNVDDDLSFPLSPGLKKEAEATTDKDFVDREGSWMRKEERGKDNMASRRHLVQAANYEGTYGKAYVASLLMCSEAVMTCCARYG